MNGCEMEKDREKDRAEGSNDNGLVGGVGGGGKESIVKKRSANSTSIKKVHVHAVKGERTYHVLAHNTQHESRVALSVHSIHVSSTLYQTGRHLCVCLCRVSLLYIDIDMETNLQVQIFTDTNT